MRSARIKAAQSHNFSNESSFCLEQDGETMENEAMIISRAKIKDGELINLVKYDPYKDITPKSNPESEYTPPIYSDHHRPPT